MRRVAAALLALAVAALAGSDLRPVGYGTAAGGQSASGAGCEGSWMVALSIEGRAPERLLIAFEPDGRVVAYGASVVPPFPDTIYDRLFPSPGMGQWEPTGADDRGCAFDVVRLLADEAGDELGTVYLRGTLTVEADGVGIAGSFTYAQGMPSGRTIASGDGAIDGLTILVRHPAATPSAATGAGVIA